MFTANEIAFLVMCGIFIAIGVFGVYSKWAQEHETSR